jgi:peptide/nickel transport system ATP-binding protein
VTESILVVDELWKSYPRGRRPFWRKRTAGADDGDFHALAGVSLKLAAGSCLGVVGESGSGKSTLVRMLAGLSTPSRGLISLRGQPLQLKGQQRGRVQMVFQDPTESLNPSFRVQQTIREPLQRLRGFQPGPALEARIEQLCDLVQLPRTLIDRYPHQLSGGQRARVGIARALAPEPDVLLLDEPTTALDVSVQARILLLLADLRTRLGTSFVFVTHDLGVVRLLCDRVLVMKEGRIVEEGETAAVMQQPAHPYTRALVDALPRLPHAKSDEDPASEARDADAREAAKPDEEVA